ncbi:MAG: phage portal protein [Bdellovibrionales bacterium]|jgi:HK97 family phage portal protein|nr:phage portal protein [Bdellovibrionales bacterium]
MGWKNIFGSKNKHAAEAKASASAPLLVQYGVGQPRFTPRQYDQLAKEAYQKNVIAYRCIRLISQNAAAVPWVVMRGKGAHKTRMEDHPLAQLLSQPNPMQGGAELFASIYGFYLIAGNGYIEAVCPKRGDTPRELWTLRPDRMRIIPGHHGIPSAYRYQVGGNAVDFPVDGISGAADVLHLKSFHPLDDWYGMSALEAAAASIDQHNDAAKWNAALLQSSGRPSGALIYKPPHAETSATLTDEQRQSLKTELEAFFTGAGNAGRPLVLEGGLDWREMSLSPKDMDWLAGKDVSAREIALAFHVPPQLVGIDGSLTFANFEQARLALFDDAILPLIDHVKDELNHWLAPRFGDDISIDYDVDKIEAFAQRREKIWQRVNAADFLTLNEKRAALGLPPLTGGDNLGAAVSKTDTTA